MKRQPFTQEQKILHHLILHAHDVPTAIGLLDGMTGVMLVLAHYARARRMPVVEHVADYLMTEITGHMNKNHPIGFGDGMAGVGWGMEYLIQNGYVKGCGVDLTAEMDERIMSCDIRRMDDESLEKGLTGLFHYVAAHVQGAAQQGRMAFDHQYLNDWMQTLKLRQARHPQEGRWKKMYDILYAALQGQLSYQFDLVQFIKPMGHTPMKRLGLRNGLAGYMELLLQAQT